MRSHILLLAVATALFPWLAAAGDPPKPPDGPAGSDTQDFVYLGEARPVLVRLHLQVDGKSYQAVWDDFMQHVFTYLDTNGDGVLSKEEVERTPPPQMIFNNNFFGGVAAPALGALDTSPQDGRVTPEELANYYRRSGGAPFQFQVGPGQGPQQLIVDAFGRAVQSPSADALNQGLLTLLDADKDGKLSKEEMAAAPLALLKLDTDDDEMVTVQEVLPDSVPSDPRRAVVLAEATGRQPADNSAFALLTAGESPTRLTRQLQTRYGPKGGQPAGKKLTRKDIGLDQATFDRLDADGDGELDSEELARFASRPADVVLVVKLGKGVPRGVSVDMVSTNGSPGPLSSNLSKSKEGGVVLDLGTTRLDFRGPSGGAGTFAQVNVRQNYVAQFKVADRDNNGYLDMNEVRQNRSFQNLFKVMDRDGDGKVFEKEMLEYVDTMRELQSKALASCTSLTVSDQGRGLFDLIDTNRDGRLSVREKRNAIRLVDQLDRDGDGQISLNEIPRSYLLAFAQGPVNANQLGGRVVVASPFGRGPQAVPTPTAGPLWFRKMDRNRDGDVSTREFLGTQEEFRRIDTDGDGLLSSDEAVRADDKLKKEKGQGR